MDETQWLATLEDWFALRQTEGHELSTSSATVYRAMWRAIGRVLALETLNVAQLSAQTLSQALTSLKLTEQSRRRYLQLLGHVLANPPAVTELLEDPPPPRHLPAILTGRQEALLAEKLPNLAVRQQHLVALVLGAGLRAGEVSQARWGDFRLDEPIPWLVVRKACGKPLRSTPVAPWALPYLIPPAGLTDLTEAFVFANDRGRPVAASTLWRDCEAVLRDVLGSGRLFGATRLRNTYGLRNLAQGAPLPEVKDWLGHHQEDTTARLLSFIPPKRGAV